MDRGHRTGTPVIVVVISIIVVSPGSRFRSSGTKPADFGIFFAGNVYADNYNCEKTTRVSNVAYFRRVPNRIVCNVVGDKLRRTYKYNTSNYYFKI